MIIFSFVFACYKPYKPMSKPSLIYLLRQASPASHLGAPYYIQTAILSSELSSQSSFLSPASYPQLLATILELPTRIASHYVMN